MKKTSDDLSKRKHLHIHQLRNSELKAALGGQEEITCGGLDDECVRLTVVVSASSARYDTHKVVLPSNSA
jgi:membrane-bound inhibitor of C-type lysozyme